MVPVDEEEKEKKEEEKQFPKIQVGVPPKLLSELVGANSTLAKCPNCTKKVPEVTDELKIRLKKDADKRIEKVENKLKETQMKMNTLKKLLLKKVQMQKDELDLTKQQLQMSKKLLSKCKG